MVREGASRVYLCASHGVFVENCMELIDLSPVDRVIVTDSVQLHGRVSPKIVQVSVAAGLAKVIQSELKHMSYALGEDKGPGDKTGAVDSIVEDEEEYALE